MKQINELNELCTQATACFEALSEDGSQKMFFAESISLPRAAHEQVANHLARIKNESQTDNVKFIGIIEE